MNYPFLNMVPLMPPVLQTHINIPPVQPLPAALRPAQQPLAQPPAQEQVNGGVSHVLDYDVELMTRFVMKNAYFAFRTEEQSEEYAVLFHKGVSSVLNATRFPSVTIYLALDYLFKYIGKLSAGPSSIGGSAINVIYQNTMVAFILANKFNDDKTFTNKSWSQATGMDIETINDYEREWLKVFDWKLYSDKFVLYPEFVAAYQGFQEESILQQHLLQQQQQQQQQPVLQPQLPPTSTNHLLYSSISSNGYEGGYQTPLTIYSSPSSYFYPTGKIAANPQPEVAYNNDIEHCQHNFLQPTMPLVSPLSDIGRVSSRDEFSDNSFDYDFYNFGASQNVNVHNNNNLFQPPQINQHPQTSNVNYNTDLGRNNMLPQPFQPSNDLNQFHMMNNAYYKPVYNNSVNNFYPYSTVY